MPVARPRRVGYERPVMRRLAAALIAVGLVLAGAAHAEIAPERTGQVESLPQPPHPHWVWAADLVLRPHAR